MNETSGSPQADGKVGKVTFAFKLSKCEKMNFELNIVTKSKFMRFFNI